MKRIFFILMALVLSSGVYASFTLSCEWRENFCIGEEKPVLYGHNEFVSNDAPHSSGKVLSSHVSITGNMNYNQVLCCSSPYDNLDFSSILVNEQCGANSQEIMYLTSGSNARLAVQNNPNFDISDYTHKICLNKPEQFATIDMIINETNSNFNQIGYSCIYRTSDLINGHVSSCDATFNGGIKYNYTVFARMWETQSSLECNSDCTSKLDNRVYSSCATQIESCRNVHSACDGSLYGAWVTSNASIEQEVQCSAPWNNFRGGFGAFEELNVQTVENQCNNLISREYQVLVDNQLTTMKVLVCMD